MYICGDGSEVLLGTTRHASTQMGCGSVAVAGAAAVGSNQCDNGTRPRQERRRKDRRSIETAQHFQPAGSKSDAGRTVESLERLLDVAERSPASRVARLPIVQLAGRIRDKRYKKTISRAKAVDESRPAEAVHELRIGCKKLRYSLEFFGALFEPDGVAVIVKQLKRLQDTLGVFNDLSLQQSSLAGYLKERQSSDTRAIN
jgi:CHAD domain-containing protein